MDAGKQFRTVVAADGDPGPAILEALEFTRDFVKTHSLQRHLSRKLMVVVEELVANALRHGAIEGGVRLQLWLNSVPDGVALEIHDDGTAFDPTLDFRFTGPNAVTGGGTGLEIARSWVNNFQYCRIDSQNRLTGHLN